jgi:predicted ATPase
VAARVAAALGVGERPGGTIDDAVLARLAGAEALVVLDNCEHLVDGVAVFVERLLAGCPRVRVLATSRTRLMLPFEQVFSVPGLSLTDGGEGDAVALFVERAAAGGRFQPRPDDLRRMAGVCRSLDGMALAIELAAARLPTLGLDGLETGLADALRMLTGGSRLDERHQSLRSTIDWSYQLLSPAEQALLRRVSVFAAPFTAQAAIQVAGFPPVDAGVADGLARLADNSLAIVVPGSETRYRVLETIRQYGLDRLGKIDGFAPGDGVTSVGAELAETRARHVRWCVETARTLDAAASEGEPGWRSRFDAVADDLRAALAWSASEAAAGEASGGSGQPRRTDAHGLARGLAGLTFLRGLLAESQSRFEHAATLAPDDADAAGCLEAAAGAALGRHVGTEAMRLWREAADASIRAGDPVAAAHSLALAATLVNRGPGIMAEVPPPGTVNGLLREATALAAGPTWAEPAILTALAFAGDGVDPVTYDVAERAVELARRVGTRTDESAALDELSSVHLAWGDIPAAVTTVRRRADLLASMRTEATTGLEMSDGYAMASEISLAAGDFARARAFADRLASLPFMSEADHLATARRIKVDAMAGDLPAVLGASERFRRGWDEAGRPVASNLGSAVYAVAMVHGLRGDEDARARWRELTVEIGVTRDRLDSHVTGFGPTFDAIVHLHEGDPEAAVARLAVDPEQLRTWFTGQWRTWYAALWAEAAVLARRADAAARVERARVVAFANPVAVALVDRAAALAAGDPDALEAVSRRLEPTGCLYQWARTLALRGGDVGERGRAHLAAVGAAPMGTVALT